MRGSGHLRHRTASSEKVGALAANNVSGFRRLRHRDAFNERDQRAAPQTPAAVAIGPNGTSGRSVGGRPHSGSTEPASCKDQLMGTVAFTGVAIFVMFVPVALTYNGVLALCGNKGVAAVLAALVFAGELFGARKVALWLRDPPALSDESLPTEEPSLDDIAERFRKRKS